MQIHHWTLIQLSQDLRKTSYEANISVTSVDTNILDEST